MLQLRLTAALNLRISPPHRSRCRELYSDVIDRLSPLDSCMSRTAFRLTEAGLEVADAIAAEFLQLNKLDGFSESVTFILNEPIHRTDQVISGLLRGFPACRPCLPGRLRIVSLTSIHPQPSARRGDDVRICPKVLRAKANPIGVDFGTDSLRLCRCSRRRASEYRLLAAASADVPPHVRNRRRQRASSSSRRPRRPAGRASSGAARRSSACRRHQCSSSTCACPRWTTRRRRRACPGRRAASCRSIRRTPACGT